MARLIAQVTVQIPRLIEAGEYRKLRYAGDKPSLQQIKKWIDEGVIVGEVKGGMYFVDLNAELTGSDDPLLQKMMAIS
ncbi:hypothetical protein VLF92_07345 [Pseudomonas chengduensis]